MECDGVAQVQFFPSKHVHIAKLSPRQLLLSSPKKNNKKISKLNFIHSMTDANVRLRSQGHFGIQIKNAPLACGMKSTH